MTDSLIEEYFLFLQKKTGINVQKAYQSESKQYPLIVFNEISENQFTTNYDRNYKDNKDKRVYRRTVTVQVTILSSFLNRIQKKLIPIYNNFMINNSFFSGKNGSNLSVFSLSEIRRIPFLIESHKPIFCFSQDLEFTMVYNYEKEIQSIDIAHTIKEIEIRSI